MKPRNYDIKILDTKEEIDKIVSNITDRGLNVLFSKLLINPN